MPSITIRDIDEALRARLRVQAAVSNRSMEDQVRVYPPHDLDRCIQAAS